MAMKPGSIIGVNQFLSVNDYIQSPNRVYFAVMQGDGNFCVYRGTGPDDVHGCVWHTNTVEPGAQSFAIMQGDGNFCVYRGTFPDDVHGCVWHTNTVEPGAQSFAVIEDDGNFCVYRGTGPDDNRGCVWDHQDTDPIVDYEISSIDYDVGAAKILSSKPSDLFTQSVQNDSSIPQTNTIGASRSVEETSGWSNSLGFKAGVETEIKCGVPILAEGSVKVSLEVQNTYTWSGSTTRTKKWSFSTPLTVPPGKVGVVLVSATISTIMVPYNLTGTLIFKSGTRMPGQIKGLYTGTNSHDLRVTFDELVYDGLEQKESSTEALEATSTYTVLSRKHLDTIT